MALLTDCAPFDLELLAPCHSSVAKLRRHLIGYTAPRDWLQMFRLIVDSGSGWSFAPRGLLIPTRTEGRPAVHLVELSVMEQRYHAVMAVVQDG